MDSQNLKRTHRRTRVLTIKDKEEILHLLELGWTQKKLADLYGVSQPRISQLIKEVRIYENENSD